MFIPRFLSLSGIVVEITGKKPIFGMSKIWYLLLLIANFILFVFNRPGGNPDFGQMDPKTILTVSQHFSDGEVIIPMYRKYGKKFVQWLRCCETLGGFF